MQNKENKQEKNINLLPEGILCGGYCRNCRYSEPYNDGWYYCNYKRKSVDPNEWHECCE